MAEAFLLSVAMVVLRLIELLSLSECGYSVLGVDETYHHMMNKTVVDCIDHTSFLLSSNRTVRILMPQVFFHLF